MHSVRISNRKLPGRIVSLGVIIFYVACSSFRLSTAQRVFPPLESDPNLARELFSAALKKLQQKKIPFDPHIVVKDGWRERIDSKLWDLPDIKKNLRVSQPMEGLIIANLLMVGEAIKLKGDTLLLINELAPDDENRDLKISGKGDFFMFIVAREKRLRFRGIRGTIWIQTTGRCLVAGRPQGYTVIIACGRRGFVMS